MNELLFRGRGFRLARPSFPTLLLLGFTATAIHPALAQQAQILSHKVIAATPPDSVHYEKAIGNFTNATYPSYFLGTSTNGYIYDTQTGQNCSLNIPAEYYERAHPFTYPGDTYAGIMASLYTTVDWLENPKNWGGSVCGGWPYQAINPNRGAHEIRMVDFDGDGKLDVLGSGAEYPSNITVGFLYFQNASHSWVPGTYSPAVAESVDVIAINGINGGARTNIVGCNAANNSLYWYQNPGGTAARGSGWTPHLLASNSLPGQPACNQGAVVASLNVGSRDILIVSDGELNNNQHWSAGLGYFDPGSNPMNPWTFHQIDGTYMDVHQIATDTLYGVPFFTIGEQEQASSICNGNGYNQHGTLYQGCRVAIYAWTGSGFGPPTLASNLGTHNQTLYQLNGIEYMAGANHDTYKATDPAYSVWTFNFGGSSGIPLPSGTYTFIDPAGLAMDLGWALNPQWGDGNDIYLWSYHGNSVQQVIWNSSGLLQSAQNSTLYLYSANKVLALGTRGDHFNVAASGTGYTIFDTTVGLYVNSPGKTSPPNTLNLSSTPTVWTIRQP